MKCYVLLYSIAFFLLSCNVNENTSVGASPIPLDLKIAHKLVQLPFNCIQKEFPNKPGQILNDTTDLKRPKDLHPAFYGCFDWHSSVHGHWSLIKLIKEFPDLDITPEVLQRLQENLNQENIEMEIAYFHKHKSFERTYGWAWYLKLVEEIHTWDHPLSQEIENNLQPLTDLIEDQLIAFLPNLLNPVREGTHSNTAFGLTFAWDYAHSLKRDTLKLAIEKRARYYFIDDILCPINYEPGGEDFLSPCLQEIDLMRRVLDKTEFNSWVNAFLPELKNKTFDFPVGKVSDRTDGYLVHLDGLNFSRAWVLYGLAHQYPEYDHLVKIANKHVNYSLPNLVGDGYEGGHWLGSFAIYSLDNNSYLQPLN